MFSPREFAESIFSNVHYIVAFKNPRDQLGMRNILSQAYPQEWQEVMDVYRRETERPFRNLRLDLHPASHNEYRSVSCLLKEEGCMRCFILPS